ncbi:cytochrome c oxidase subunit 3 [Cochleicola gelatinilyticus]|uniref:Cytochrome oxidase subunit III n=1 Tax=Cochleicola gelatinilyticus TaxID=1763537 RepID=A0A167JDR2_9FLAO|nr:cytochrome c oxidase subunit 3 [Cochleicola gelatinilyticus]OAB80571.1 cytochrome oxidase subunit III [Cochleicola gelatinilyticus]
MDYTQGSEELKNNRAKKMMLWFGMISLGMSFAGLTSAYVVSKERPDWLTDFEIPQAFYISLVVILLSSVTIHLAKGSVKKGTNKMGMWLLIATLLLGIAFVYFQFEGFSQIIENGYYFTGSESTITTSFIYLVVLMHLAHIAAGLICLLVVIYNHYKQKYKNGKTLGIELAATFWHFVDILWIYLFLFFYFVR